jgi:hypothetical protein
LAQASNIANIYTDVLEKYSLPKLEKKVCAEGSLQHGGTHDKYTERWMGRGNLISRSHASHDLTFFGINVG